MDNFVSALDVFNTLRFLLKSEDNWKITFRELYETTYTLLWRSLLRIGKINETFLAADQGRAQTLCDNMLIQYGLVSPLSCATFDSKDATIGLFTELSSQIIFLALDRLRINIWFLRRGQEVAFRQGMLEADITEKDPICALLQASLRKFEAEVQVTCEDRTFVESDKECSSCREVCEEVEKSCQFSDNPFRPFYDAVIAPIVDLLGSQFDELVIVLTVRRALRHGSQLLNRLGFVLSPLLPVINRSHVYPRAITGRKGRFLVLNELKIPLPDLPCAQ